MSIRVICFLFFLWITNGVFAQKADSIFHIQGVEITASKISMFISGVKIQKIDTAILSIRQGTSIATLLAEQMPVNIRTYGPGGLSTLSIRGTNSSQSGVFWNGINLNQSNNGQADLSRLSTIEFSDVILQSGSASALLGSGIIGGSLHLSNELKFTSPVRAAIMFTGVSDGNYKGAVKLSAGGSKLAYSGSLTGDWNRNAFYYTDFSGNQKQMEHALVKTLSTIHQAEAVLATRQRLKAGLWYQVTDKQIPPTMTMISSDQKQWDQAIRSTLQWSYIGDNQMFSLNTAFVDEKEHYQTETAKIDAFFHVNRYQASVEYKKYFTRTFTLGSGVSSQINRADIENYQQIKYQNDVALWLGLVYTGANNGIKGVLNLRQDFSEGYKVPFCPSLSFEIPVSKKIMLTLGASRNFRIPTMNDRYWVPGGNPDLKPEKSWNFETGATYGFFQTKYSKSNLQINIYSNFINDFIQWVPGESNIWSPQNVSKVWSRGLEIASRSDWKLYGFKGYFNFGYNFSPSTTQSETETQNNQLVYVPLHKISEVFYVTRASFYGLVSYAFTGKRFVVSDNSQSLPSYSLLNFQTGYNFNLHKMKLRLQFEINNLLNTSYQSVQYYPEPGISYALSLLFTNN